MAQQADYSLDFYSLNDVFYSRVKTYQPAKQTEATAPQQRSDKKHSNFLSSLTHRHRGTSSYAEKSSPCSTSEHLTSPRSSISS